MTPITPTQPRLKRTFQQFTNSQENDVIQGRDSPETTPQPAQQSEQPRPAQQSEQPQPQQQSEHSTQAQQAEQPIAQAPAPAGIRGYLSRTLAWTKKICHWATNKRVAYVTIEMPEEGRIQEQRNKRRFVVPGAWPESPFSPRRFTPRRQPTHQVQPVSPSPTSQPLIRPAAIEMQPIHQAPVVLETTTVPVTAVTPVAAEEGSRPDALPVVAAKRTTGGRQPRRKQERGEPQKTLKVTLGTVSPNIPKMSRPEGKPVSILRKTVAAQAVQRKIQQQKTKAARRVHFGEENQFVQRVDKPLARVKYYDIEGICGEAPSPLNRSSFQTLQSSNDDFMSSPARSDVSTPDRRPIEPSTLSPIYKKQAASTLDVSTKKTTTSYENKTADHDDHDTMSHNAVTTRDQVYAMTNDTRTMNEDTQSPRSNDEFTTIKTYIHKLKNETKNEVEAPSTPTTKKIDELVDQYELFGLSAKTRKFRQDRRKKAEERAAAERKRLEEEAAAQLRRVEEERQRLEEERAKKEVEERKKRTIVTELTKEWKNKLNEAMATKNMQKDIAPNLTRKDFGTLLPQSTRLDGIGWLNDEIVNSYLTAIVTKALAKQGYKKGAEEVPKYHAFNTNLYNNYTKKGYKSVERWAQRAKIGGKRFLNVHNCLIPINNRSHWTLLSISGTERTIRYYDSLYNDPDQYTAFALAYLKDMLGQHFLLEEWTIIDASSAQQANGVDCGVFVCMNALALALGREPLTAFSSQDAEAARQLIAATLLNGGFEGDFNIEL